MPRTRGRRQQHRPLQLQSLPLLLLLGIAPAVSAFAWLWPDWLHAGHPLAAARARPARPAPHRSAAAASASEPPQPSSSGPDVCRPTHLEPPVDDQGAAQDWPELRSILGAIHREAAEPALVDKGPTVPGKEAPRPRRARVDWWERALSPKLRTEYELYYGEGRAYSTIVSHVRTLKRLFAEAAPAIFVAGEHTFTGDHRPHPVVDTGGVATALPLTTKEQLRAFLHRYHDVLTATAEALPGRMGANALSALRYLTAYANDGTSSATRRRAAIKKSEAMGPPAARRFPGLWGRLVSSTMQQQFADMQRFRNRSEGSIAATLETLPRLFGRLPLEPYEDAALVGPFGSTAELRRFLRRHHFDMLDVTLERERAGKGDVAEAEEALAELWLFALLDRPDAIEWVGRWKRHLEELDEAAAREADRMVVEWEMIAARALGEVEMARERERVLGEMMAWARRVKEGRQGGEGVGSVVGVQSALGAEEGGPGAVDAFEEMIEAVGELQEEEDKGIPGKGFRRPPPNNNGNGGQPPEGKRGKRRYRRPWWRGQDRINGGNGGS